MDKTIKVDVTRDDIRNGRKGNAWSCAIAVALQRSTGAKRVRVCNEDMTWWMPTGVYKVKTSIKALRFIRAFDDKQSVQPCSFTLKPLLRKTREK